MSESKRQRHPLDNWPTLWFSDPDISKEAVEMKSTTTDSNEYCNELIICGISNEVRVKREACPRRFMNFDCNVVISRFTVPTRPRLAVDLRSTFEGVNPGSLGWVAVPSVLGSHWIGFSRQIQTWMNRNGGKVLKWDDTVLKRCQFNRPKLETHETTSAWDGHRVTSRLRNDRSDIIRCREVVARSFLNNDSYELPSIAAPTARQGRNDRWSGPYVYLLRLILPRFLRLSYFLEFLNIAL